MRTFLLALAVVSAAAGAVGALVDVNPWGDASGEYLAVSLFGNSTAPYGVAVSGTGHAQGGTAVSLTGDADAPVPLSATGDCDGRRCFDLQPSSDANGYWLAASGTGDAFACEPGVLCKGVAVSGLGNASGLVAVSALGEAHGGLAGVAGGGVALCATPVCVTPGGGGSAAEVCALFCVAANPVGPARSNFVAVSGTGDAEGEWYALSGTGNATGGGCYGCLALSGTGASTADEAYSIAGTAHGGTLGVSVLGDANACDWAVLCFAVAGTGDSHASHAVSVAGDAESPIVFLCTGGRCYGGTAVSLLGDSSASIAVSVLGDAAGNISASGAGACNGQRCFDVQPSEDADAQLLAVSGSGDSRGFVAVSALGDAQGQVAAAGDRAEGVFGAAGAGGASCTFQYCVVASATGPATCQATHCTAVSATGTATGGAAGVSGTGDATGFLLGASGTGDTYGEIASFSAFGDARAYGLAVSLTGDAHGGFGISGTGHASGIIWFGGCDDLHLCVDPL